jgi:Spy/CpxP family protein refolding chaperone
MESKKLFGAAIAFLVAAIFALVPALAAAQDEPGEDFESTLQKRIMERMNARFDRMSEALHLTPQQEALLNDMKAKTEEYATERMEKRQALWSSISEEAGRDNPDFDAIGKEVKANYQRKNVASFDAMVDASVAFHKSLTPEQRAALKNLREKQGPAGRGKWRK